MNPTVSLTLSLLLLQYLSSTLASESSAHHYNQNSRSLAEESPILLNIRTVSAPLGRPSFVDQSTSRKSICRETGILQGFADDASIGENTDIIRCNVDREPMSRLSKPSPTVAGDGSAISNGNIWKRFRPKRSWLQHIHSLPSIRQDVEPDIFHDKSTVSENLDLGASETGEDTKVRQTRENKDFVVRTKDGKLRVKKSVNLNPWSRHMFHLYSRRQKSLGTDITKSGGLSPVWQKRVWEDIDMPAWGKRHAADDHNDESKDSRTIDRLAKPRSLSYGDDDSSSESKELTKEEISWGKRDWEDIDMHAWGKRDRSIRPLHNII